LQIAGSLMTASTAEHRKGNKTMNTVTIDSGNSYIRTVTVGMLRSSHKGEILLVYLNDGEVDAAIMRFDQLSRKDRYFVRSSAQDPLSVQKRTQVGRKAFLMTTGGSSAILHGRYGSDDEVPAWPKALPY
jgi:hypothetical protein